MLTGLTSSGQAELDCFFADLANRADRVRVASARAFSKARYKLRYDLFQPLLSQLVVLIEAQCPSPRWHGLRVVAADASTLRFTKQDHNVRSVVDAVAFALFLPGMELCLAASLFSTADGERQMLFEHLHLLAEDDLLVLDRGYPAAWLAALLSQSSRHFCIRCDISNTFKVVQSFTRSGLAEAVVVLPRPYRSDAQAYECDSTTTQVRLVRVVLPSGRSHVLMTSLLDSRLYPAADFGALYHARWRIEEAFKRFKHRLNLEHTSGMSWHAARQDFGAKAICDNLNAFAAWLAHDRDHSSTTEKNTKVNRTQAFAHLKRRLGRWLLRAIPSARAILNVFQEIAKNLQIYVPGRQQPRPSHPKPHKHPAYKGNP
jgi:hypothetical protein